MKRLSLLFLVGCLTFCSSPVFADETDIDLTGMDFDSLSELKQKIDTEYYSRPESEPFTIAEGQYEVGKDIAPGQYYIAMVYPGDDQYTPRMHVYADRKTYDSRPSGNYGDYLSDDYFSLGEEPKCISLSENNFVLLQNGSVMASVALFDPSEYFVYEAPEGTYVPAGTYFVGNNEDADIPVGKYSVYPATINPNYIQVYHSKEAYEQDGEYHFNSDESILPVVLKTPTAEALTLDDGYVLIVGSDVIMTKNSTKLSFD